MNGKEFHSNTLFGGMLQRRRFDIAQHCILQRVVSMHQVIFPDATIDWDAIVADILYGFLTPDYLSGETTSSSSV
eukprot:scaffold3217_cov221-Alexandrium_tamarense.AAC.10